VNTADYCIQVLGGWYGSKNCLNCILPSICGMAIAIMAVPVPPAMVHADDRHTRSNIVGCKISCSFYLSTAASHHKVLSISANFAIENRQAINGKFADLLTNVRNKMLRNVVDTGEFCLFVLGLFNPGDCIPPLPTKSLKPLPAMAFGTVSTTPHLCKLSESLVLVILRWRLGSKSTRKI